MKKIIQQSNKFRKHGRAHTLTVEHVNLALGMNHVEEIYGLGNKLAIRNKEQSGTTALTIEASKVDLVELAKRPLPRCPLAPELNLHWLAVHGVQPRIPENPIVVVVDEDSQPTDLPKEMQLFYTRATASILSLDKSTLRAVFQSFENDSGLQELLPFFSLFIYRQIKNTTRSLPLLTCLVQATRSLIANPHLRHEFHLHQLVPVILTCAIGANLSESAADDHWELRQAASETIAMIVKRYRDTVSDLQPRVCKTYMEGFGPQKSLVSVYGSIIGLTKLGHSVIRNLLLPLLNSIAAKINLFMRENLSVIGSDHAEEEGMDLSPAKAEKTKKLKSYDGQSSESSLVKLELRTTNANIVENCRAALLAALGKFMITSMRVPNVLELEMDSLSTLKGTDRRSMMKSLCSEDSLVADMAEGLIPYYVSTSKQLDYCRMFL